MHASHIPHHGTARYYTSDSPGSGVTWNTLYRVAAWAALLVVAMVPVQTIAFIVSPPPDTVIGWFRLFKRNQLLALVDLDVLYVIDNILAPLVILGLVVVLWRTSPAAIAIAGMLGFLGAAAFFSSNPAFSMLSLSHDYWGATADAERATYLAAGEAMMSTWQSTSYLVSYELGGIATVMLSGVMLRSAVFSRATGYLGLATGVLMIWPPVNLIGMVISLASLAPLVAWYILIARRLFALANIETPASVTVAAPNPARDSARKLLIDREHVVR